MNDINFTEFVGNVVTLTGNHAINGTVIFQDGVNVTNDAIVNSDVIVEDTINGINISELFLNSLKTTGDQIVATKTITGHLSANNLTVQQFVNGLNIEKDLVTKYTKQTIAGDSILVFIINLIVFLVIINHFTIEKLITLVFKNIFSYFLINSFQANALFLYPLKNSENLWFLIISGGTEKDSHVSAKSL